MFSVRVESDCPHPTVTLNKYSCMVLLNCQHCTITGPEDCYALVFVDDIEAPRSCTPVGFKVSRNNVFWFTRGGELPHERASSVHAPRVLGAKRLLGSRLYGWTGSSSDAIAHRIFATFRLRAHSMIRLWCVLDVQLIKKETLPERESVSRRENHSITNVESGKSEQYRFPSFH